MPYVVLFPALAFQRSDPTDPTGKTPLGTEEVVRQYGRVPEWVPEWQLTAYAQAGMIGPAMEAAPVVVESPAPFVPLESPGLPGNVVLTPAEQPPVPDVVEPEVPVVIEPDGGNNEAEPLPALPKSTDNKDTWEQYATRPQIGMTLGEAEAMNKTDLMAEVKRRHEAASN